MASGKLTQDSAERGTEYLLKLTSDRANGLEAALEKNWIAHLILAGAGLALVFNIGSFRKLIFDYFVRGEYDQKVVAIVVLAFLLYYFMKLGHLLTLYVEADRLRQQLLKDYLGGHFDAATIILGKSTNFYVEAFFSARSSRVRNKPELWQERATRIAKIIGPYLFVTTTVVSLAQASALFLVAQAYGLNRWFPCVVLSCAVVVIYVVLLETARKPRIKKTLTVVLLIAVGAVSLTACVRNGWPSLILLFAGAVIVALYILFWSLNRELRRTNIAVASSPALAVVWLFVFGAIAR